MSDNSGARALWKLHFERWAPAGAALIFLIASLYFREAITDQFTRKSWDLSNLYTAIFDWSAIQTGFLFAVYGFIAGKAEGFIYQVRNTVFMRRYINYTKRAMLIGFVLTVVSIPLIVGNPDLTADTWGTFLTIALWFSLFVWAFSAFLRVAFIFGVIARIRDTEPLGA